MRFHNPMQKSCRSVSPCPAPLSATEECHQPSHADQSIHSRTPPASAYSQHHQCRSLCRNPVRRTNQSQTAHSPRHHAAAANNPPMPNSKAMTTATHFEHLDNNSAPDPRTIIVIAGLSVRNRRNSNFCDAVQDGNHHSAIVSNGVYCSVDNSGSQNAHNDWVEFYMM